MNFLSRLCNIMLHVGNNIIIYYKPQFNALVSAMYKFDQTVEEFTPRKTKKLRVSSSQYFRQYAIK